MMLFVHPMWFHEAQRIGKRKCTPTGYALHVIAELIGFLGLSLLLLTPMMLARRAFAGSFRAANLWILAVPFGVGIASEVLFQFSWWLARRKGFQFNDERSEASWSEAGGRRTYRYSAEPQTPDM